MTNERQYMSSWSAKNSELTNEVRQVSQKYEAEIKTLSMRLEEEKERASEAEASLSDLQADMTTKAALWKESEQRYKDMVEQA